MFGNAGPRAHGALRHEGRALRPDRLEEPQALGEQPVRAVPGRVHARRDQGVADGLRAADQAAVLPDVATARRAAIVASERFVDEHGLGDQAVEIVGQSMDTDFASTFDDGSDIKHRRRRHDARRRRGRSTRRPGSGPRTSTSSSCTTASRANELITYEALGLCEEGEARRARSTPGP